MTRIARGTLGYRELRHRLEGRPVGLRGDRDLNQDLGPDTPLRKAAVLIGVVERDIGPTIVMTERTDHLQAHAGQISFPGGRIEADDADATAAALREAEEEIGLSPSGVEVLGRLDTYVTRTGFEVVPIVARVAAPVVYRPDPFEVKDVFELPVEHVLADGMPELHARIFQGRERRFYAFPWSGRFIWGATAGMLYNLRQVLNGDGA